jgi:predicted nucleic acid-binding protein
MNRVREVLATVTTTRLTVAICDTAGRRAAPGLRSLDALHLASALDLGDDLEGLVGYDDRLADGARTLGIPVVAPT